MATALHNLSDYDFSKVPDASNMCFGIVVAEWNPEITGALLDGAVKTLEKHGALPENIHVKTVPGSFELIYGAHQMVLNGGYLWHRTPQCNTGDSCYLWSPDHQRPAAGQGPQRWQVGQQG